MASPWRRGTEGTALGAEFRADWIIATSLVLVVLTLAVAGPTARAADSALSQLDQQCLACHSAKGLEMKLADGDKLSLQVEGAVFAKSVHSKIGCAVCHANTSFENHPPIKRKIAGGREYSLEMNKVCQSCHAPIFKLYEGSIHAAVFREGNAYAPVCIDCHNPHAVMAKAAYDAASGAPCSKCHDPIYQAYAGSVHGKATLACSNCHRAHDVSPATTGDQLKNACLECHQGALDSHKKWLPNAGRHFDAVSCPACHSPAAKRKVDLRLYDTVAQKRVAEKEGVPQFETRARLADAKSVTSSAEKNIVRIDPARFSRTGTSASSAARRNPSSR